MSHSYNGEPSKILQKRPPRKASSENCIKSMCSGLCNQVQKSQAQSIGPHLTSKSIDIAHNGECIINDLMQSNFIIDSKY